MTSSHNRNNRPPLSFLVIKQDAWFYSPALPVRRGVVPVPNFLAFLGVAPVVITGGTDAAAVKTSWVDSEFASARSICIGSIFDFDFPLAVGRIRVDGSDSCSFVFVLGILSLLRRSLFRDVNIPSRNFVDWWVNWIAAWVD